MCIFGAGTFQKCPASGIVHRSGNYTHSTSNENHGHLKFPPAHYVKRKFDATVFYLSWPQYAPSRTFQLAERKMQGCDRTPSVCPYSPFQVAIVGGGAAGYAIYRNSGGGGWNLTGAGVNNNILGPTGSR